MYSQMAIRRFDAHLVASTSSALDPAKIALHVPPFGADVEREELLPPNSHCLLMEGLD